MQSILSVSNPQYINIETTGASVVVVVIAIIPTVGRGVGKGVGTFVGGFVGMEVVGGGVGEGSTPQGVFGKQARPSGHSDDDPLGHGLRQVVDAS
jgi:hypothetical protein